MRPVPDQLMLFAAGFGTRMGALTKSCPKPLIPVAGRALIDHALHLAAQVPRKVVNLHYLGDRIAAHLAGRPGVAFSWEDPILDTGGGLRAARALFEPGPVFTLNSDAVWTGANPLDTLRAHWDAAQMSALLLLAPPAQLAGHPGSGDFVMDAQGRIERASGRPGVTYLGAQIIDPDGLLAIPDQVFSMNRLWDQLIAQGRAFGCLHPGGWCDVGHPGGIAEAEALLRSVDVP